MSERVTPPVPALSQLGDHWGLVVTFGAITVVLGLVLVFWPAATLVVLAVLLAMELIVTGLFKIVSAFGADAVDGGVRALLGLSGAVSVIVGLLCLRAPLQTVVVIGLLLGAWWAVSGIIEIFTAVLGHSHDRGWRIFMGLVSVVAGAFLLVNPELSLGALVVVVSVWLFGYGAIAVVAGFRMRSVHRAGSGTAAVAGAR